MCRLRYCVSHCLREAMTRLEVANGEINMWSSVRCLDYLAGLNLLVALCLGLYVRWEKTEDPMILIVSVLALFVLGIAVILYYYFSMQTCALSLLHLWFGFLLGLLCFLNSTALQSDIKEKVTNYLLLASISIRTLWALLERMCGCVKYRPAVLTAAETMELAGFASSSAVLLIQKSMSVVVLVVAMATLMLALRAKALMALANLACFSVITAVLFFKALDVTTNPFALACFFTRLICIPLLDVYFSGLSVTERWLPYLDCRGLWRRLSFVPLLLVEVGFLALATRTLMDLTRWYLMIPGFVLCGLFWLFCHMVFLITLWGFNTKLSDCQRVCQAQGGGTSCLDKVMASKGVRHFCLLSEHLMVFSLLSTIILAALSWQSFSSIFISVFLLVLALECLFHGLFHELGKCLGGTCVGYAVVIPTNYCSSDGQPILLPPEQVHQLNMRSTGMLNTVQRFFNHHMIEEFGCDYSTSGVTLESLQAKLKAFMELCTTDGLRHDTYVVFYSGHTHRSGEWALAGGDTLQLDHILQWWKEKNIYCCSRLVLVLDTENSLPWVKDVRMVEGHYVAVQGAQLARTTDVELQDTPQLGDFTSQWVEYNCNPNSDIQWSERGRTVTAVYGISKHWSDYTLQMPTGTDAKKYWRMNFPKMTYPVIDLALESSKPKLFWLCSIFVRLLKRIKLNWFPPAILDTGHGFKLVKS
ncbi:hypothetical protein UPYG_G00268840 [Umbra pygmaea]|uniref:Transmembrane protein 168 n=1 Tax=Umbra pygmaea TaxID=75934 RepID=A0ABD0WAF8_UMBPY